MRRRRRRQMNTKHAARQVGERRERPPQDAQTPTGAPARHDRPDRPARRGAAGANGRAIETRPASERSIPRVFDLRGEPLPRESARRRASAPRARAPRRSARARGGGPRPSPRSRRRCVAEPVFSMKLACLGAKRAPPTARPLQPASASSSAGGAPLGPRILGVLEGRAERLDPLRLGLVAARAHLGERGLDRLPARRAASSSEARATISPSAEVRVAVAEAQLAPAQRRSDARGRRRSRPTRAPRSSSPP